ncbi:MAG: hypothetical protein [Inoviridae sp. ctBZ32]|nr:MAG: hypothetical protein [Inoviridae sp. ctBZ32]
MQKLEGVSKKTGSAYLIRTAQVVCQIDGSQFVAKVAVPREMADILPGVYDITTKPFIDREGQLQFAIASYVPVDVKRAA